MERLDELRSLLKEDATDPFLHYALAVEEVKTSPNVPQALIQKLECLKLRFPDYLPIYDRLAREYLALDDELTCLSNAQAALKLAIEQKNKLAEREMLGIVEELTNF